MCVFYVLETLKTTNDTWEVYKIKTEIVFQKSQTRNIKMNQNLLCRHKIYTDVEGHHFLQACDEILLQTLLNVDRIQKQNMH